MVSKKNDHFKSATFGSFNLELLMAEALFSLIVRKIRCFWKSSPKWGALSKDKKKPHITEEIYLLNRSIIDRIIFKKRYIEICLRNVRKLLDIAA